MSFFFNIFINFLFFFVFLSGSRDSLKFSFTPSSFDNPKGSYCVLTNAVAKATNNIYGAIHEIDLVDLSELFKKKSSNIYIELLLESRWTSDLENKAALQILKNSKIKIKLDKRKSGLMHNKYLIIDDQFIWTGSANFTYNGFFKNYNDGILIENKEIAQIYKADYFRIQQNKKKKFYKKIINFSTEKFNNISITPIFSRTRNIDSKDELIKIISKSKKNIQFLSFVFSSYDISYAIEKKLKQRVKVMGLFDDSFESDNVTKNWKTIPFQRLWQRGANVKYDDGNAKMHHKAFIIDDEIVVTGSFNFSRNAVKNNNENYLIISNQKINQLYKKRFNNLWQKFPEKTLYEQYVIAKRKNKEIQNFNQFIRTKKIEQEKKSQDRKSKIKKNFQGKVVLFNHEGKVGFLVKKSFFFYPLYGIDLPIKGNLYYNQEPQHTMVRQKISAVILHKNFSMKIFNGGLLIFDKDKKLINAQILKNGFAYLNEEIFKNKKNKYNQFLIDTFREAQKSKKFLFSKKLQLIKSPSQARKEQEQRRISFLEKQNKYSQVNYQKGYLIGNRNTKKYYYPNNIQYKKYLRNLEDSKLIFFKNKFDAEKVGYTK